MKFPAGLFLAALTMLVVGLSIPAGTAQAEDGYGSVTGRFVFKGDIPKLKPLVPEGAAVRDAECCAKNPVPNESLVVNPENKGLAHVFVWIPKVSKSAIHPDLRESEKEHVVQDQKNCQFVPHALVVRTDQSVLLKSDDPVSHNALIQPFLNTPINNTVPPNFRKGVPYDFSLPEMFPSTLSCSIHGWMNARWLIVDHPYAAATDKNGEFKIEKLPAGEHEFNVWQERAGWVFRKHRSSKYESLKVTVKDGETVDLGEIEVAREEFDIEPEEVAE